MRTEQIVRSQSKVQWTVDVASRQASYITNPIELLPNA